MRPKKLDRVERTVSKYHVIAPHEAVVLLRKCADDIFHGKDFSLPPTAAPQNFGVKP